MVWNNIIGYSIIFQFNLNMCVIVYAASDAKRVRAFGRGIQPHGLRVQDEAKFKIVTEGAGEGVPDVNVIGPGKNLYLSMFMLREFLISV